jgi:hypothetical protein
MPLLNNQAELYLFAREEGFWGTTRAKISERKSQNPLNHHALSSNRRADYASDVGNEQ